MNGSDKLFKIFVSSSGGTELGMGFGRALNFVGHINSAKAAAESVHWHNRLTISRRFSRHRCAFAHSEDTVGVIVCSNLKFCLDTDAKRGIATCHGFQFDNKRFQKFRDIVGSNQDRYNPACLVVVQERAAVTVLEIGFW